MSPARFPALLAVLISVSPPARGQSEGPPNEPPYTSTLDEEFDQAAKSPGPATELKAGEAAEPAAEPQVAAPVPVPVPVEKAQDDEQLVRQIGETGAKSRYIKHPNAKKGLRLIDRDGSYYYAIEKISKKEQTSTIRLGAIQPPPAIETEVTDRTFTYSDIYGDGNPMTLLYDYEWTPLKAFGELGVQAGFGFFTSQGNGRFVNKDADGNDEAREKYTFYGIPLNLGVIYRFNYFDNQWVVPYASGGGSYFVLAELRDDAKAPKFVGTPAAYGGGGLMFNISAMDRSTGFSLDSEYGINTLWMTLEARRVQAFNQDLDVSGNIFTLGFGADY